MSITALLVTFLAISLLVAFHEGGHWGASKIFRLATPIFQVGMFSPFIKLGRYLETDFRVSPWLIGGFCLIPEMFDEQTAKEVMAEFGEPNFQARTFPVWKRALVAVAGPVMSYMASFLLIFGMFATVGIPYQSRDTAMRNGVNATTNNIASAGITAGDDSADISDIAFPGMQQRVIMVLPLMPVARKADSQPDGVSLKSKSQPIVTAGTTNGIIYRRVSVTQAAIASWQFNIYMTKVICRGLAEMFSNLLPFGKSASVDSSILQNRTGGSTAAGASDMHGMVGIFQMAAMSWAAGLYTFIGFMAILSLNWAVFNMLPIPMLDGGFLIFLGWEALTGKRLARETELKIRSVFLLLLLAMMLFGLYNDFAHPVM